MLCRPVGGRPPNGGGRRATAEGVFPNEPLTAIATAAAAPSPGNGNGLHLLETASKPTADVTSSPPSHCHCCGPKSMVKWREEVCCGVSSTASGGAACHLQGAATAGNASGVGPAPGP
ncbi:hypothetical protein Vafri_2848, partial [Volvox africanus]